MTEITLQQICDGIALALQRTVILATLLSIGALTPEEVRFEYSQQRLSPAHFEVALDMMEQGDIYEEWTPGLVKKVQVTLSELENTMLTW